MNKIVLDAFQEIKLKGVGEVFFIELDKMMKPKRRCKQMRLTLGFFDMFRPDIDQSHSIVLFNDVRYESSLWHDKFNLCNETCLLPFNENVMLDLSLGL